MIREWQRCVWLLCNMQLVVNFHGVKGRAVFLNIWILKSTLTQKLCHAKKIEKTQFYMSELWTEMNYTSIHFLQSNMESLFQSSFESTSKYWSEICKFRHSEASSFRSNKFQRSYIEIYDQENNNFELYLIIRKKYNSKKYPWAWNGIEKQQKELSTNIT